MNRHSLAFLVAAFFATVAAPSHALTLDDVERDLAQGNIVLAAKYLKSVPIADNQANRDIIAWSSDKLSVMNSFVLLDVSRRVFIQDKQDGLNLYTFALMWLEFEGEKCADSSARSDLGIMAMSALEIAIYQKKHPAETLKAMQTAAQWEQDAHPQIPPTWLCHRGASGYTASAEGRTLTPAELFVDTTKTPEIHTELRKKWHAQQVKQQQEMAFENVGAPELVLDMPQDEPSLLNRIWGLIKGGVKTARTAVTGHGQSYHGDGVTLTHTRTFKQPYNLDRLAWSPNGRYVTASSMSQYKERVWDYETGKVVMTTDKNAGNYGGITFTPDSRSLITSETVKQTEESPYSLSLWDIESGTVKRHFNDYGKYAYGKESNQIEFTPQGDYLINATNAFVALEVLRADTFALVHTLGIEDMSREFTIHPTNPLVAFAHLGSSNVQIWNYVTGNLDENISLDHNLLLLGAVSYSPNGRDLAIGRKVSQVSRDPDTKEVIPGEPRDLILVQDTETKRITRTYHLRNIGNGIKSYAYWKNI